MAINKGTLGKRVNDQIELIYPKTSADMVAYDNITVEDAIETLDTNKVDKVEGKGLSTNDFTNELLTKLNTVDETAVHVTIEDTITNNDNPVASKALYSKFNTIDQSIQDLDDNKVDKITGKGLSTNDYTTDEKSKLSGIEAGAQVNTVTSVNGKTGAVVVTKTDLGISNVDNTADANKRVAYASEAGSATSADEATHATSADEADKLAVPDAGNATTPVYFDDGVPVALNYTIQKSVPSDAVFTDTTYSEVGTTGSTPGLMTVADKVKLNGIATGAEENQNAFSNVIVNSTTINSNSKTDTISFTAGDNITLTPNATNKTVTIAATDTVYTHPKSGVIAGTYTKVTVDANGHVTTGANPTTLAGYGITDAETAGAAASALASANDYTDEQIESITNKIGTANGIATLDNEGKVPASQLPSYVDDTVEGYYNDSKFYSTRNGSSGNYTYSNEIAAESGKIYVSKETNLTYRWSGTQFVEISPSLALGETSSTAYRGDRGKIAYDHSQTAHAPSDAEKNIIVGVTKNGATVTPNANRIVNITVPTKISDLTNDAGYVSENTTYENATTTTAGLMSASDKTKLDGIEDNAEVNQNAFSIVKVGGTNISASTKESILTLSAGDNVTLTPNGSTVTIAADDTHYTTHLYVTNSSGTSKTTSALTNGNVYLKTYDNTTARESYKIEGTGATTVTTDASGNIIIDSTNTTYNNASITTAGLMSASDKTKLDGITASADAVSFDQTLTSGSQIGTITINSTPTILYAPTPSNDKIVVGANGATSNTNVALTNGNVYISHVADSTNTSSNKIEGTGATTVTTDTSGNIIIDSENTTYGDATTSDHGLMSASDKTKLESIAAGAEVNQNAFSSATGNTGTASASSKTDTLAIEGSGVISTSANGKKITISTTAEANQNAFSTIKAGITNLSATSTTDTVTITGSGLISVTGSGKTATISTTAEANQNAFSIVKVGDTNIEADTKTDTLTLSAGSNITLTPNASTDTITIAATDTTDLGSMSGTLDVYHGGTGTTTLDSGKLLEGNGTNAVTTRSIQNNTTTGNLGLTASNGTYIPTMNTIANFNGRYDASNSNIEYVKKGAIGDAVTHDVDTSPVNNSSNLITSGGVYTALDSKANSDHTHNYAGSSSAGGAATSANKLNTNAGSTKQPVYFNNGVPVAINYTIEKNVPANAVLTTDATTSDHGLMSASDKIKLNSLKQNNTISRLVSTRLSYTNLQNNYSSSNESIGTYGQTYNGFSNYLIDVGDNTKYIYNDMENLPYPNLMAYQTSQTGPMPFIVSADGITFKVNTGNGMKLGSTYTSASNRITFKDYFANIKSYCFGSYISTFTVAFDLTIPSTCGRYIIGFADGTNRNTNTANGLGNSSDYDFTNVICAIGKRDNNTTYLREGTSEGWGSIQGNIHDGKIFIKITATNDSNGHTTSFKLEYYNRTGESYAVRTYTPSAEMEFNSIEFYSWTSDGEVLISNLNTAVTITQRYPGSKYLINDVLHDFANLTATYSEYPTSNYINTMQYSTFIASGSSIADVTPTEHGLMTASDKIKLDNITSNQADGTYNKYYLLGATEQNSNTPMTYSDTAIYFDDHAALYADLIESGTGLHGNYVDAKSNINIGGGITGGSLPSITFLSSDGNNEISIKPSSVITADVALTLPTVSGTLLNTGTTSYTAGSVTSSTAGAYKIGTIKINNTSTDIYGKDTHPTPTRSNSTSTASPAHSGTFTVIDSVSSDTNGHITGVNTKTVTLPAQYSHPTPARSNTTSTASPAHGGTFTVVDSVTSNTDGHITGVNTKTITLPADSNTHYSSKNIVGASNTAYANAAATNGNVYINHIESNSNTPTSSHKIIGTGTVIVTSDANGNITIDGEDTNSGGTVTKISTTGPISGGDITTTGTISHATSGVGTATSTAGFYKFKYDTYGHVTGVTAVTKSDLTGLGVPADDTHYTSHLYVTNSSGTAKTTSALTNGNVYLKLYDNSTARESYKVIGAKGIEVITDASGNITIQHTHTDITAGTAQGSSTGTLTFGGTFTIPTITYDAQGHITGKGTTTMTMPANPNTNTTYTIATGDSAGQIKVTPSSGSAYNVTVKDVATLVDGKIPTSQLPSYVSDVWEYADLASFPTTGESNKIYVDKSTNKTYRWGSSSYTEISASLALGETASTAYRGDRGKIAYDHSQAAHLALGETSSTAYRGDRGKIAYDHSQTAHAPSNAQANQNAFSNVTVGSTTIAADTTTDTLTIVAGSNITLTPDATNDKLTIAATNTDTKVTAVGNHYTPSGGTTTSASGGTLTDITNSSTGVQVLTGITKDAAGHITGVTSVALKSTNTDNNTTYTNASLGNGIGTCTTAAATAAKVATLSDYVLNTNGRVSIWFQYAVPANATLNINSKGAKSIKRYTTSTTKVAITANIIKAGDTATFVYDGTDYVLIGLDKPTYSTASVGSASGWSAGTTPTLGTALSASKITAWNAGSTPTLGTAIAADDITAWSAGTLPTLGTDIAADDITAWSQGTLPSISIANGELTFNAGSLPSLSYTARSIPNVTGVGTLPSLSYTARSIPNVTSAGSAPSITYEAVSIPNVTSVGTAPSLTVTPTTVVTSVSAS